MSLLKIRKALENALEALPGIIPAASIVASTVSAGPVEFETAVPHNLRSGLTVKVIGHSYAPLNSEYKVVVVNATRFTLQHPTLGTPITSAAGGVGGVVAAQLSAWEGAAFKPLVGVAYQAVSLLPATPENATYGPGYRESGIFQVVLNYPPNEGTGDITARAELIRAAFPRGASFTADGLTVNVRRTPEILPATLVGETLKMTVRFVYQADVFE